MILHQDHLHQLELLHQRRILMLELRLRLFLQILMLELQLRQFHQILMLERQPRQLIRLSASPNSQQIPTQEHPRTFRTQCSQEYKCLITPTRTQYLLMHHTRLRATPLLSQWDIKDIRRVTLSNLVTLLTLLSQASPANSNLQITILLRVALSGDKMTECQDKF